MIQNNLVAQGFIREDLPLPATTCRVEIFRHKRNLRQLWPRIVELQRQTPGVSVWPTFEYFLCLNRLRYYSPMLVCVWNGSDLMGAVCGGEAQICGLPVGVAALGLAPAECVSAKPAWASQVFSAAVRSLLTGRRYHTLYLYQGSSQYSNLISTLIKVPRISYRTEREEIHERLALPGSFESFLGTLGRHTRRNLKYYRRRAEACGIEFRSLLSSAEVTEALSHLVGRQRTSRLTLREVSNHRKTLNGMATSFWCGLREKGARWVALIGGWLSADAAYVVLQLNDNDPEYDQMSLSVVARACLIEELTASGIPVLSFIGGCNGLLQQHCAPDHWYRVIVEKRNSASIVVRTIGRRILRASTAPA